MDFEQDDIVKEAEEAASNAEDSRSLYEVKMQYLGRAGKVTALMKRMKDIAQEHRPAFGKQVNALREKLETDPSHPQHLVTVRGFGYQWREVSL